MSFTKPRRRFGWIDAATLIAATALGLALAKDNHELYTSTVIDEGRHNAHGFRLWRYVAVPLFASWTIALVPLQLWRPRPRLRHLVRRPGFATSLVVVLQALRAVVESLAWLVLHHREWGLSLSLSSFGSRFFSASSWLVIDSDSTGFIVAAIWFALRFGRWWQPEASWIDRAGRALGWYWISMFTASCYEVAYS